MNDKRKPREGDPLVWADGHEYKLITIGVWQGAERFTAQRPAQDGSPSVTGVTIGLVWDQKAGAWRYPSVAQT